jgi:IS5 family transposase
MRQRFEQQLSLATKPISDIKIPLKSRDELPAIVRALQFIFTSQELNEKVFSLLETKICTGKKKTGRPGMDLWHILVLAVVRQGTSTNWDRLHLMANQDSLVRAIMGISKTNFSEDEFEFEYQNILDNVSLIDEDLLYAINNIVVEAGHQLLKKKEKEVIELQLKTDSYVLETNVHFPTDLNLLWDSCRKCLDTIEHLQSKIDISGWRKINHIRKTLKSQFRTTSHQVFKGKSEAQKKQSVRDYLHLAKALKTSSETLLQPGVVTNLSKPVVALLLNLKAYVDYVTLFINQIERRLLKGETIPASEKIYSIFEPHTEWITKGKQNKRIELGHLLLVTTDQHQFMVDYKIMEGEKDASQVNPLIERLSTKCVHKKILSHSFDKGFWSKENYAALANTAIQNIILPKKGKLNTAEKERQSTKIFKQLRNQHSAVESNINMLEHHGLNRCMDKGLNGYKRCVGLSVLAYNLHILGNALKAKEIEKLQQKLRLKKAA